MVSKNMEIWPEELNGAKYGLTIVVVSSILFYVLGRVTQYFYHKLGHDNQLVI
jgi:hypothetical protein